ncbi:MAG: TonB-dependent receptor domain-containing protein [bacterium]
MKNQIVVALAGIFVPALLFAGTVGKISGTVTDSETGVPLPGANIMIMGTSYGAAANTRGEYVILNVPVGAYALRASFIGYSEVTIKNIRVNVDLTTTANFGLPSAAIVVSAVEIVAERPLVNTNATNSVSILTSDEIRNLPLRGYHQMVSLAAGAVTDNDGTTYVRGGRVEETAYYIDGVYQNNLRFGTRTGTLAANSIEEVSVQAGGFNAEYGFANSAVVNATTKSGRSRFNVFGEIITDEWLSKSNKRLGTFSYGHNVVNLAISGPFPGFDKRVRFFGAIERDHFDDRTPSVGIHPVLIEDRQPPEAGLAGPEQIDIVEGRQGPIPNNDLGRWVANANITIDLRPVRVKIGGNTTREKYDDALDSFLGDPDVESMLFNSEHNLRVQEFSQSLYFKVTHTLGANTFYGGQINYFEDGNEWYDPLLKRDIVNYGDKTDVNNDGVLNPDLRGNGLNNSSDASTANLFEPAGTIFDDYGLNRTSYIGAKFDMTHQRGRSHEFKLGFEYRRHTVKRYRIYRPMDLAAIFANNPDIDPVLAYTAALTDAYGYQFVQDPGPDGDLKAGGLNKFDQAKHPIIYAVYLQDKIEVSDLVLNLGLRIDHFDANAYTVKDPLDIKITDEGIFDRTQLRKSKAHTTISPRLGVAFPVTEGTVFYGQFGKFTQQPPLRRLYVGWEVISNLFATGRTVNFANPDLKPPTTTSFEVGFRQQIGDHAAVDLAAYYKQTRDLIQFEKLVDARPQSYFRYANGDYGTIKGVSMNLSLRRTARVAAGLSYTLQFAGGTGSTGRTNARGVINERTYVAPTDFDQRHTGSLNVDVRFNQDDGPTLAGFKPLANTGVNLLLTFGSGFPYTPRDVGDTVFGGAGFPRAAINSSYGPWNIQLDMRIDRTFDMGGVNFNVYLWAINVLGARNWDTREIYSATGDIADNGYLASPEGQTWIAQNGGEPAANLYRLVTNSPDRWSVPRQMRLGLRFDLTP